MSTILVVDDDTAFRDSLTDTLRSFGHSILEAGTAEAGLHCLSDDPDMVFLDLKMPGMGGLEFLRRVRKDDAFDGLPVVILTAFADGANTIEAMQLGAFDHLTKPLGRDDIQAVIAQALNRPKLAKITAGAGDLPPGALIGTSPVMHEVQKRIGLAAPSEATVLILGETGTGKELAARALHQYSLRSTKPFAAINCAAIPAELLESELFGHVRGAFTGAALTRTGRFKEADGGTLFLDEVGDMSLPMQAKILRALQERVITPVGGSTALRVDVRFLAGTHRNLVEMVKQGQFREDLFYRLNVLTLRMPPLRERGSDILALAEYFLRRAHPTHPKRLSASAATALLEHAWPGNVRELENLMQEVTLTARGPVVDRPDLHFQHTPTASAPSLEKLLELDHATAVSELEKLLIARALQASDGNRSEAARRLNMHRQLFYKKMKEFGLEN